LNPKISRTVAHLGLSFPTVKDAPPARGASQGMVIVEETFHASFRKVRHQPSCLQI
jgi:hypothetical protein